MQEKPMAGEDGRSNAEQDRQDQRVVLAHVVDAHPAQIRLSDLIRELTDDPDDFAQRDGIERAVRDLVRGGLLFRGGELVLPTRATMCLHDVLHDGEGD